MSILSQAITLVSEPPGSFVYHLLSLLALEAALAIAIGHYRRAPEADARHLAVAAGVSLAARLVLVVIAALGAVGLINDDVALPPLSRATSLATFIMIGWALTSKASKQVTDGVFGGMLILVLVAAIVSLLVWQPAAMQGTTYNHTLDDKLWQVAQLGALVAMTALLSSQRPPQWGLAVGMFALPALASLTHLYQSLTSPLLGGHVPAFHRFAELAALPMFVMIVYDRVLRPILEPTSSYYHPSPVASEQLQAQGQAAQPVSVLQTRLERLQQEWDALEARLGELGDTDVKGTVDPSKFGE